MSMLPPGFMLLLIFKDFFLNFIYNIKYLNGPKIQSTKQIAKGV